MNHYRNIIIGAGAAGLILAAKLNEKDTLMVTQNIGGLLRAVHHDGFIFDLGGHVYTTKDSNTTELLKAAGANRHFRRAYWNSRKYGRVPFPVQNSLAIAPPEQLRLEFSLEDFAINQFGEKFYIEFFKPFNKRVWTTDPKYLSFDWIRDRVSHTQNDIKNKKWGINSDFLYAPGDSIIQVLRSRIKEVTIINGASVRDIDIDNKIITYEIQVGQFVKEYQAKYDRLFITHTSPCPTNKIAIVGIGLNRKLGDKFHWMYPDFDSSVHRITLLSRYFSGLAPYGKDSLLLEIPYKNDSQQPEILNTNNKKFVALELAINSGINIDLKDIETVMVTTTPGYPIPMLGARKVVENEKLNHLFDDIYHLGRWGSHGYFNLQHIFADVETVIAQLKFHDPLDAYISSTFYYK